MRIKFPRTYHLPWSEGRSSDDKVLASDEHFEGKEVISSVKMDGENTSLYPDYSHARSVDSKHHPSRDWLKAFHASFKHLIPENLRICGENLYAKHSIYYEDLTSYFQVFSMWEEYICLSWDDTIYYCNELKLEPVQVLYRGIYDRKLIHSLYDSKMEGYVIRLADSFHYDDYDTSVAKFVRKDHVQTNKHWTTQEIIPNKLKG